MTWAWGPFLAFDCESTGLTDDDRMVQYGLVHIGGDWRSHMQTEYVDPEMPIPAEATAIHGITDDDVREGGLSTGDAVDNIMSEITIAREAGTPLVVFNAPFDLGLLDRELTRTGRGGLDYDNLPPIIDPLVLVNRRAWKRPHNLEHACEVWKVPAGGHDAGQDALAAARLLWLLGQEMRVQIKAVDGWATSEHLIFGGIQQLSDVPLDVLQRAQARWFREDAESFIRNQQDKGRDPGFVNTQWPVIRRPRIVKETV